MSRPGVLLNRLPFNFLNQGLSLNLVLTWLAKGFQRAARLFSSAKTVGTCLPAQLLSGSWGIQSLGLTVKWQALYPLRYCPRSSFFKKQTIRTSSTQSCVAQNHFLTESCSGRVSPEFKPCGVQLEPLLTGSRLINTTNAFYLQKIRIELKLLLLKLLNYKVATLMYRDATDIAESAPPQAPENEVNYPREVQNPS